MLIRASYGFVKFHNFKDAEDCIRGFHMLGYETSFARVSRDFEMRVAYHTC